MYAEKHLKEKETNVEPKILKKELKAMRFSKYALYTNIDTVDWKKKKKLRNGDLHGQNMQIDI